MGTKHNYYCEMCCNTFDQDDVHCPICGNGMVTQAEQAQAVAGAMRVNRCLALIEAHKARRNAFGLAAAKLKAIYEDMVDYKLPKEAPRKNPSYLDSPQETSIGDSVLVVMGMIDEARKVFEYLESRLDEHNQ